MQRPNFQDAGALRQRADDMRRAIMARSSGINGWAIAALLAATVLALGYLWWRQGPVVSTAVAMRGRSAEVVYATGVVEPVLWAKVSALSRGRIVEICDCEGREVRKGDVLARLDDAGERAVLAEFEARLERHREDAERLTRLLAANAATRTALDEKLTQIREQESRIAGQRERIANLELRSPIDGVVLRRDGEVGEIAQTGAGDVLLWVGQPRPLRVEAEVNEEDILRVREGQSVLLRHDGHTGSPLAAQVGSITPKGDPQNKTFRVYIGLPDDTPLKIGMSVEANVVVREVASAVLIPPEAIGAGTVLKVVDQRVKKVPVETGVRGTRLVEVTRGITEGDAVITPYKASLSDGARVRPQPAAAAAPTGTTR